MLDMQIKQDEYWLDRVTRKELKRIKPYIPGRTAAEVLKEYSLKKVVKLASNENPLGVSSKVREALAEQAAVINRYPDGNAGMLKEALAEKLGLSSKMILTGNGSDGLLKIIAETFLSSNDQVIISHPTFVEYVFVSYLMGSQLVRVFMPDYHQNLRGIAGAVNRSTRLIFLTNPHNPAGTIFTDEEFQTLLGDLPDDVVLVVDEAYREYVQHKNYPDMIKYIKQGYPIIILRTFSKAYGLAGLRLGYALARPDLLEVLSKAREPFNVNHLAQIAGIAALQDEEFLARSIAVNRQGKNYLYRELERRGLEYVPTEANFILVKTGLDSFKLFTEMLSRGVIIRPGLPLGYENHIRVSIGLPAENEFFISKLDEILEEKINPAANLSVNSPVENESYNVNFQENS